MSTPANPLNLLQSSSTKTFNSNTLELFAASWNQISVSEVQGCCFYFIFIRYVVYLEIFIASANLCPRVFTLKDRYFYLRCRATCWGTSRLCVLLPLSSLGLGVGSKPLSGLKAADEWLTLRGESFKHTLLCNSSLSWSNFWSNRANFWRRKAFVCCLES